MSSTSTQSRRQSLSSHPLSVSSSSSISAKYCPSCHLSYQIDSSIKNEKCPTHSTILIYPSVINFSKTFSNYGIKPSAEISFGWDGKLKPLPRDFVEELPEEIITQKLLGGKSVRLSMGMMKRRAELFSVLRALDKSKEIALKLPASSNKPLSVVKDFDSVSFAEQRRIVSTERGENKSHYEPEGVKKVIIQTGSVYLIKALKLNWKPWIDLDPQIYDNEKLKSLRTISSSFPESSNVLQSSTNYTRKAKKLPISSAKQSKFFSHLISSPEEKSDGWFRILLSGAESKKKRPSKLPHPIYWDLLKEIEFVIEEMGKHGVRVEWAFDTDLEKRQRKKMGQ